VGDKLYRISSNFTKTFKNKTGKERKETDLAGTQAFKIAG